MTTQATHTPGPWEIGSINKRDKNLWWSAVFTPKSTGKFHTPRACDALGVDREECEGNARLIAAAPDLLNACKELVEHLDSLPDDTEKCRHLKMALNNRAGDLMVAAIAKAEGRAGE